MSATRLLLQELVDYAGLFPPASLAMAPAVANYDTYLRSECNWILGRFVVPVIRLGEFEEAFAGLPPAPPMSAVNWRLSVLPGSDPVADVSRIYEFNGRMNSARPGRTASIESVEVKAATPAEIAKLAEIIPAEFTTYFEIPLLNCAECLAAIAACRRRAKIRTGGETAHKFPTSESVLEFMRLCGAAGMPFKATAGLHHPLRSVRRLTYEPDSPSGLMHGFINLFLAAAFLRVGMDPRLALELLEERSAEAFNFGSEEITWRNYRLNKDEVVACRREFAVSFGSCSFTEPVDGLRSLHLL